MTAVQYKEIGEEEAGQRIDNFLFRVLKGVPKSKIYKIIRSGEIRVNKKRVKPDYRLQNKDILRIPPIRVSTTEPLDWKALQSGNRLMEHCIHEDKKFLVINKPSGIAVHGGSGLSFGVIESLRETRSDLPYLELVHRIDRETSGCLVLAKKRSALRALHQQFQEKKVDKCYWTLVDGRWDQTSPYTLKQALEKNVLQSGERIVRTSDSGKPSQTKFILHKACENFSLVEAQPLTGRTHQIRVHCSALGHAILGDDKYGSAKNMQNLPFTVNRLYLHAKEIRFTLEDVSYCFEAPLDADFSEAIEHIKNWSV